MIHLQGNKSGIIQSDKAGVDDEEMVKSKSFICCSASYFLICSYLLELYIYHNKLI